MKTFKALFAILFIASAVSIHAQVPTPIFQNIWNVAAGDAAYMTSGSSATERGIAVSPVSTNVLLVSRAGGNFVKVLNGADGTLLGDMNTTGMGGGTFTLSTIRVARDGVVYVGNLSVGGSTGFRVYRWDAEDPTTTIVPVRVFGPDAVVPANFASGTANRYGDSFDLRGSGLTTQIAVSGSGNPNLGILTTTDGTNFTGVEFPLSTAGLAAGEAAQGISFYTNNTLIVKKNNSPTAHLVSFDLGTSNLTFIADVDLPLIPAVATGVTGMKFDTNGFLFCVITPNSVTVANHRVRVYDFSSAPASAILDTNVLAATVANANGVGAADNNNALYVGLDTQNGIQAFKVVGFANNNPPVILSQSGSVAVLDGGYTTLTAAATGTQPLKYQWYFNTTTALSGKTNTSLVLTNIQLSDGGEYSLTASNAFGTASTTNVTLTVKTSYRSAAMSNIWSLLPGSRNYIATDNNQRGLAFNPSTSHLLLASRTPTNGIHILNPATGADLGALNMTGVGGQPGETFPMNMIGCGDDGAIYGCNLTTTGNGFTIYRWADENPSTTATIAYGPNSPTGARVGDTFGARRSGTNTQLIAASSGSSVVAVFTTTDGLTFTANTFDVTAAGNVNFANLGLAFGSGETFWAKSTQTSFARQVIFDLTQGTNDVIRLFAPAGSGVNVNIGVDPVNGFIAGVIRDTPDNLGLYDISDPTIAPPLLDQEFFGTDNDNGNGTGAVAFDINGGRVFALNSNNGIIALNVIARLKYSRAFNDTKTIFDWTGPSTLQSASSVTGAYANVSISKPYTNSAVPAPSGTIPGQTYFRLRR